MGKYLDKQGVETLWNKTKALNELKQDRTSAELTTEAKSIVEAINEVNGKASAGLRLLGTISPGDQAPAAEQSADGYYLATQPGQYFNGTWLHKTHIGIVTQQDGRWKIKFVRTAPMPKPRVIAWRAIPLKTARPGDIYIISQQPWLKGVLQNGTLIPLANETEIKDGLWKLIIPANWANLNYDGAVSYIKNNATRIEPPFINQTLELSSPFLHISYDDNNPRIVSTHLPPVIKETPFSSIIRNGYFPRAPLNLSRMMVASKGTNPGSQRRVRPFGESAKVIWKLINYSTLSGCLSHRSYFSVRRAKAVTKVASFNQKDLFVVKYIHKSSVIATYRRYAMDKGTGDKRTRYYGISRV